MEQKSTAERFTLFGRDADLWEQCGLNKEDENALVLALWNWYRGRPDVSSLSVPAKLVYAPLVARWVATEAIRPDKVRAGRIAGQRKKARSSNASTLIHNGANTGAAADAQAHVPACAPAAESPSTATATSTATSTALIIGEMGDAPILPAPNDQTGKADGRNRSTRFVKPTEAEVRAYLAEIGFTGLDPARFVDYYAANGWMVGKSPMKDWKSAVRNWQRRDNGGTNATAPVGSTIRNPSHEEADYVL